MSITGRCQNLPEFSLMNLAFSPNRLLCLSVLLIYQLLPVDDVMHLCSLLVSVFWPILYAPKPSSSLIFSSYRWPSTIILPPLPPTTHSQTSLLNPTAQQQPAYQLAGSPRSTTQTHKHIHFGVFLPLLSPPSFTLLQKLEFCECINEATPKMKRPMNDVASKVTAVTLRLLQLSLVVM